MNGIILRVTSYHGEPQLISDLYVRAGVSHDVPITKEQIINHPDEPLTVVDVTGSGAEIYTLDQLVDDFEDEYGCKITIEEPALGETKSGPAIYEFNIFEPAWEDFAEAEDVLKDLAKRTSDWIVGYPAGR